MIVTLPMLVAAFLLLTYFVVELYIGTIWQQNEDMVIQQFTVAEEQIDHLLYVNSQMTSKLLKDTTIEDFVVQKAMSDVDHVLAYRHLMDEMKSILSTSDSLAGIVLMLEDGSLYGTMTNWAFYNDINTSCFLNIINNFHETAYGVQPMWSGTYTLQDLVERELSTPSILKETYLCGVVQYTLTLAAKIQYNQPIYLFTLMTESSMHSLISHIEDEFSDVYVLDQAGRQIAGTDIESRRNMVPEFYDVIAQDTQPGFILHQTKDSAYYLIHYKADSLGWTLVKKIDSDVYLEQINAMRVRSWVINMCVLAAVIAAYYWLVRFLLRPFQDIVATFKRVQSGRLDVRLDKFSGKRPIPAEMELIRAQMNYMLDSIEDLLDLTRRIERERGQMELRALQAQLNPHMIFNSISAIRWMTMLQGDNLPCADNINQMLIELAELLRPIFGKINLSWTLREEMQYVDHYIKLLRLRYGSRFDVCNQCAEAYMNVVIPRFTLQPILENCCEHGTLSDKVLQITLDIFEEGSYIVIRVTDNGRGIPKKTLTQIQETLSTSGEPATQSYSGIGLANVNRQLKAMFGEDCGLTVESEENVHTRVTVRIKPSASVKEE